MTEGRESLRLRVVLLLCTHQRRFDCRCLRRFWRRLPCQLLSQPLMLVAYGRKIRRAVGALVGRLARPIEARHRSAVLPESNRLRIQQHWLRRTQQPSKCQGMQCKRNPPEPVLRASSRRIQLREHDKRVPSPPTPLTLVRRRRGRFVKVICLRPVSPDVCCSASSKSTFTDRRFPL